MVTVVRDEAAALHAGLDQSRPLGKLLPLPVNLNIDHRDGRGSVLGLGFGRSGGSAHRWIIIGSPVLEKRCLLWTQGRLWARKKACEVALE